jgi:ubiquinone/menaquinone biosynthesis C-methylase UbiE
MKAVLKTLLQKNYTLARQLKVMRVVEGMRDNVILPMQSLRLAGALARIPQVKTPQAGAEKTGVDDYWGQHTISPFPFFSVKASLDYIQTISDLYPLYYDYCGLYNEKPGKVILDYGCGPGNDVTGWMLYSKAKKVIAMDISRKALEIARKRLALHVDSIDPQTVEFIQVSDTKAEIPLEDNSVDYINCLGVLHHTTNPDEILLEFKRVLKPGGEARLMLYHYDSVYVHLCVAYELQVQQNFCPDKPVAEAYETMSDGGAPHSRLTTAEAFVAQAEKLGFEAKFAGAAYSVTELASWRHHGLQAANDERLKPEHREFLKSLTVDARGYPMYKGREAGLDAVFSLKKKA